MIRAFSALLYLLGLAALAGPSLAQSHFPPRASSVYGVGCYWHRGHQYCNRYCWREIDGHRYCQERLRGAGTQAPPPEAVIEPGSPVYRQGRPR